MSLRNAFRRFLDRLLGRRASGPEPPPRLREEAELQVLRRRSWTPQDWASFAADLAEGAYRDAYRRGFEDGSGARPAPRLGAKDRYGWSIWGSTPSSLEVLRRRGDPSDPLAGVSAEKASELVEQLERNRGTYERRRLFRVVRHETPPAIIGGSDTERRLSVSDPEGDGDE